MPDVTVNSEIHAKGCFDADDLDETSQHIILLAIMRILQPSICSYSIPLSLYLPFSPFIYTVYIYYAKLDVFFFFSNIPDQPHTFF